MMTMMMMMMFTMLLLLTGLLSGGMTSRRHGVRVHNSTVFARLNDLQMQQIVSQYITCNIEKNTLAPYGTDGRLLLTANFKVA